MCVVYASTVSRVGVGGNKMAEFQWLGTTDGTGTAGTDSGVIISFVQSTFKSYSYSLIKISNHPLSLNKLGLRNRADMLDATTKIAHDIGIIDELFSFNKKRKLVYQCLYPTANHHSITGIPSAREMMWMRISAVWDAAVSVLGGEDLEVIVTAMNMIANTKESI